MTDDNARERAIEGDLASWSLIAWMAKNQEVGQVLPGEVVIARIREELKVANPLNLLVSTMANGALLLRQLAKANGRGLDDEITAINEIGVLTYLDLELEDDEVDDDDEQPQEEGDDA